VHRDIKVRNYLQAEKMENMNLMFYDFNGSSVGSAMNTGQNFFKPLNAEGTEGPLYREEHAGDRVPTRERGYRSANLNFRRR